MKIPGLVKELLLTILLLLLSKITVDLVKNLDLVKFFLLTKNFTKSGLYCIIFIAKWLRIDKNRIFRRISWTNVAIVDL